MARAARRTTKRKTTKPAARRVTPAQLRGAMAALLKRAAAPSSPAGAALRARVATAAAGKTVTFACSNLACLVGITSGSLNLVFHGSGAAQFPSGPSTIFFRVQGPKNPATVAVTGGTLNAPISGTPAFGGMRILTVP